MPRLVTFTLLFWAGAVIARHEEPEEPSRRPLAESKRTAPVEEGEANADNPKRQSGKIVYPVSKHVLNLVTADSKTAGCNEFGERIGAILMGCYSAIRTCDRDYPGKKDDVFDKCLSFWCPVITEARKKFQCFESAAVSLKTVTSLPPIFEIEMESATNKSRGPSNFIIPEKCENYKIAK